MSSVNTDGHIDDWQARRREAVELFGPLVPREREAYLKFELRAGELFNKEFAIVKS